MRYGNIPIVRATGGLDDTVIDFNPSELTGTGFKFSDFDGWSLYGQMVRAFETYRNKPAWRQIQKNAMETNFSWGSVAKKYEDLYIKAIHFHNEGYVHGEQIE
jgi:starch synthase